MRLNIYGYIKDTRLWKITLSKLQKSFGMNTGWRKDRYVMKKKSHRFCFMEIFTHR
jgi:hypothetical protein